MITAQVSFKLLCAGTAIQRFASQRRSQCFFTTEEVMIFISFSRRSAVWWMVEREPCEAENESEEEEDEPLENVRWVREGTDPEALRYQYEEKLRMIGDYKRMAFSVLVKSGERCLSFRLGPLQFLDSANFVKESLDTMIETRKKKSKKSMEETFPVVAARHPELQGVSAERKDEVWTALMRKLPMPFEQFQGPQAWLREPVWEQEAYDSALKNEKCCDATYESLKLTRDLMCWTTFKQFHDCYLHMDCLALLDMLSALRSEFFGFFHLDLVQYVTLPGASWHALLRSLKQPISLPETAEVYSTLRKGIMGGLSAVMQPYARANHKEIPTFQPSKWPSYLFYFDVNSMYPACMCEPMPTGRAVPVPEEPSSRLLVLDFDFPEDLHDGLDFAPPCRMRVCREDLGPYNKRLAPERLPKTRKLVPYLGMHEREAVDSERLRFMRHELGARVWRLHEAITFMCSPILQPFMEKIYEKRSVLKTEGHADGEQTLKLVMNSIYGKTVQDCSRFKNTSVYTNVNAFQKAQANPRMVDYDFFVSDDTFLGYVHTIGRTPKLLNSPIQIGWRTLELARLMLMRYYYSAFKPCFPLSRALGTDTDSLILQIWCRPGEDPRQILAQANLHLPHAKFDLLGDCKDVAEYLGKFDSEKRQELLRLQKRLGAFGDESFPGVMLEWVGLCAKQYSRSYFTARTHS